MTGKRRPLAQSRGHVVPPFMEAFLLKYAAKMKIDCISQKPEKIMLQLLEAFHAVVTEKREKLDSGEMSEAAFKGWLSKTRKSWSLFYFVYHDNYHGESLIWCQHADPEECPECECRSWCYHTIGFPCYYRRMPDFVVDKYLSALTGREIKVLLFLMRHAEFDPKKQEFAVCRSTISQIGEGTGLHAPSLWKEVLKPLAQKGLIQAESWAVRSGDGPRQLHRFVVLPMLQLRTLDAERVRIEA